MLEEEFSSMEELWEAAMRYLDMAVIPGVTDSEAERERLTRLGKALLNAAEAAERGGTQPMACQRRDCLSAETSVEFQALSHSGRASTRSRI